MIVNSAKGVGVVKFTNNQFATYLRSMTDNTTPAKYMSTRTFSNYTDYTFDHFAKAIYIGNGTDIVRY